MRFIHYLRMRVSQFIYWQWVKLSRMSAQLYWLIHEKIINGNNNGTDEERTGE